MIALAVVTFDPTTAPAKEIARAASPDGLVLAFRASPVANLTHHLNCLAGIGACVAEAYQPLWHAGNWSKKDERAIALWRSLMLKHGNAGEEDPTDTLLPLPNEGGTPLDAIRAAGLRADSWDDYASSLSPPMAPADARRTVELTKIFRARFDAWWAREGRETAEGRGAALQGLVVQKNLADFFGKVARFYGYRYTPGTVVEFDLIAQPRWKGRKSGGELVGGRLLVEAVGSQNPEKAVDVVAHELFHLFQKSAPRAIRERMLANFSRAPEPFAFAAYGLLDEATATAFGQGLVSQRVLPIHEYEAMLAAKDSLYADSVVNDAAKALIQPLEGHLNDGGTIDGPDFVPLFLQAIAKGLGPRAFSPQAWFRTVGIIHGPGLEAALDRFAARMRPNYIFGHKLAEANATRLFERHPGLSGALFLKPQDLGALRGWDRVLGAGPLREVAALARKGRSFVYGVRRSEKAYVYVFLAQDAASIGTLIDGFAKAPAMFSGVQQLD